MCPLGFSKIVFSVLCGTFTKKDDARYDLVNFHSARLCKLALYTCTSELSGDWVLVLLYTTSKLRMCYGFSGFFARYTGVVNILNIVHATVASC